MLTEKQKFENALDIAAVIKRDYISADNFINGIIPEWIIVQAHGDPSSRYHWHSLACSDFYSRAPEDSGRLWDADYNKAWKAREGMRLLFKIYANCPDVHRADGSILDWPFDHFVHRSVEDPSMIAFTQNEDHGMADRQTRMKIGKYLRNYWHDRDGENDLTAEEIAAMASEYRNGNADPDLRFAMTREEIRKIYTSGHIHSCMAYDAHEYKTSDIHPSEVYASEDIAVAYLKRGSRYVARAVCNLKDKQYTRIYGDTYLKDLLLEAGYSKGGLQGCKALLLRNNDGEVICPYVDGDCSRVTVRDDCLLFDDEGEAYAQRTDGLLSSPDNCCDFCGEPTDTEDLAECGTGDFVCESCRDEGGAVVWVDSRECYYPQRMIDDGEIYYYDVTGEYYLRRDLSRHDLVLIDDEVYDNDDVVEDGITGELVLLENATEYVDSDGEEYWTTETDQLVEDFIDEVMRYREGCQYVKDYGWTISTNIAREEI